MRRDLENLTIGGFAKACGVNVETIRFYQRRALLRAPDRAGGKIRRYGAGDVARMRFIKSAQRLGFSLDEIAQLLKLDDGAHCSDAAQLAAHRLADVRAKLDDLQRMQAVLSELLGRCQVGKGRVRCPLIASLQAEN